MSTTHQNLHMDTDTSRPSLLVLDVRAPVAKGMDVLFQICLFEVVPWKKENKKGIWVCFCQVTKAIFSRAWPSLSSPCCQVFLPHRTLSREPCPQASLPFSGSPCFP